MVYIGADGNVVEKKKWSIGGLFTGIINFIGLFFRAVTTRPDQINDRPQSTYAQRQGGNRRPPPDSRGGGRGSNVRGVKHLGSADAKVGG